MQKLLNRELATIPVVQLAGERILITGSSGYLGQLLASKITSLEGECIPCDLPVDVLNYNAIRYLVKDNNAIGIIHLAAHKYATIAEETPGEVAQLNIQGTKNIVDVAEEFNIPVVLASTCKAADPCTAYGASKLIAERIVLNHDLGKVVRLVNVLGSTGSVIQIWENTSGPLPVVNAKRFWMTGPEAVNLLLFGLREPRAVYALNLTVPEPVVKLAERFDPTQAVKYIPLRRGDRKVERLVGEYEEAIPLGLDCLMKIKGPWDV